jgi:hypothetical protein
MEELSEIDTDWIKQYDEESEKYDMFYEEPIKNINVYSTYINKNKEIEEIKKSTLYLSNLNLIEKEEIFKIVSERDKKYKLSSIFTYNMDIKNDNVRDYFFNTDKYNFIKSYTTINEDIVLKPTIAFFHEMNSLYLCFNEITKDEKKRNTKKVLLSLTKPKTRKHKNLK